jgi:hypothetical protein
MKLSLATWIHLRSALMFALKAVDRALLEAYGWTPKRCSSAEIDRTEYTRDG